MRELCEEAVAAALAAGASYADARVVVRRSQTVATRNRRVGLIGTEVTVSSGAYQRSFAESAPDVEVTARPCPRFVEFVERGDTTSVELLDEAHRILGVARQHALVPFVLQEPFEGGGNRLVVIDDEDLRHDSRPEAG